MPDDYSGKFLFIGDSSDDFERTRNPFTTLGGKQFKHALQGAGITRKDVAFMPVLRCKPSKAPKMAQLRNCAPFVFRVVEQLRPNYVIAMGPNAAKSLCNKGTPGKLPRQRGRRLTSASLDPKTQFIYFRTSSISQLGTSPHEYARFREDLERFNRKKLTFPKVAIPKAESYLGFDTEFTPHSVLCGAISDGKSALTVDAKNLGKLSSLLSKATIVGHNLPVDLDALILAKTSGIRVAMEQWLRGNKQRDTLLLAKLADENRGIGGYTLESLLLASHNVDDYKAPTEALGPDPTLWPVALRDERCRLDAWATMKVFESVEPYAEGPQHITHQIAMTLHRMKHCGVYIDMKKFQKMKKEVYAEEATARKTLYRYAHKLGISDFAATDNDVRELVYGKLGLEIESYTKSGLASASVKDLKEYKDEYKEIQALLAFSKADKLKTTYVDGLEKRFMRQRDGRWWIAVLINALAAKTGRRASAGPNFQNLPVRVRQIIISRFQGGSIADNDYSKLEPIVGGWVTGEHKLTEYFTKYPNGYIKIGTDFFKKTVEKNTKEYTAVKSLILGILYNKKKWSLASDMWAQGAKLDSNYETHVDKCGDMLESFLDTLFPGVRAYHEQQEHDVFKFGYVMNAVGQKRRLPLPPEPERSDKFAYKTYMRFKSHVINQAINYPIQSLASYVTGSAMVDLEAALLHAFDWKYYDYQQALMAKEWPHMPLICIEVHDDIVEDIPKGMEKKTQEVTHEVMKTVPTLRKLLPEFTTPLSIDTNFGPCWGTKT